MTEQPKTPVLYRIGDWLVVLLLPLLFITTSVRVEMNLHALYTRGFEVYHISEVTGFGNAQLDAIATRLIDYFDSRVDTPQMQVTTVNGKTFALYHDYELIHLSDVKTLFDMNSAVQTATLIVILVLVGLALRQSRRHALFLALHRGGLLALGALVVMGVMFATDFGDMFIRFHELLFHNAFWQLDPRTDYLIMLFPFEFWEDMFLFAGIMTAALSVATLIVSRVWLSRHPSA